MEEIQSHLESGQADPALGSEPGQRQERLMSEMGSPTDLGKGFQAVHRPRRWLDFCLVAIPGILILPLLPLAAQWIAGLSPLGDAVSLRWVSLRLGILLQAGLVLIGRWKASPGVWIYWLASSILSIVALLLSEVRWPWLPAGLSAEGAIGPLEAVFWFAAAGFLLAWLARLVRAQYHEPLLVVLAASPFLFAAANYTAVLTAAYHPMEQFESEVLSIGWFGLSQVAGFLWPALFFLPNQRGLRWAGLMLMPAAYIVYNAWPFRAYPWVVILYAIPAVLVLAAWVSDRRRQPQLIR